MQARAPHAVQVFLESGRLPVDEVAQNVHLVLGDVGAQLDTGDEEEARMAGRRLQCLGQAVGAVVVGEGHDLHAALDGAVHELSRGEGAV